jgi:hypothetical protein
MNIRDRATRMTAGELQKNILGTYFSLRLGLVILSVALPAFLYGYSLYRDGQLVEHSISAFYGAYRNYTRNGFVGILWTVGLFLVGYKGFSKAEDWLLNAAGVSAVLVSIVPCNCWNDAIGDSNRVHDVFAVSFFLSMAAVCLFCTGQTIGLLPEHYRRKFKRTYRTIGIVLVVSPFAALVFSFVLNQYVSRTFFIESFGVAAFAAYWVAKSAEFRITSAEERAVRGELKNEPGRGVVAVGNVEAV